MKEQYLKPIIIFESFSLTQTIARNCGDKHSGTLGESNHYNEYDCQWLVGEDDPMIIFFEGACDDSWFIGDLNPDPEVMDPAEFEEALEDLEIDGICYNNPSGGQSIFSST